MISSLHSCFSFTSSLFLFFFFFNDTPTTEIYTLSLHDALPIYSGLARRLRTLRSREGCVHRCTATSPGAVRVDRKSTRLNSSHITISYAVFCLKKKKKKKNTSKNTQTNL